MKTSLLIITYGRPELLCACLDSALGNSVLPGEILLGLNGEDGVSAGILGKYAAERRVRVIPLPRLSRGGARNRLLEVCAGEIAVFIDDDVLLPSSYLEELEKLVSEYPDCAVFGGGQIEGERSTFFEKISYKALSSPWGSGVYRKRFSALSGTGRGSAGDFILCNLAIKKEFLRRNGIKFPGEISSAEENHLLEKIEKLGGKMVVSGRLNLFHRHRTDLESYLRQIFSFGRGRGQLFGATGNFYSFSAVPPFFLALVLVLPIWSGTAAAFPVLVYFLADLFFTCVIKSGLREKICLFFLFPATHLAYALGSISGFAEELASGKTRKNL